MELHVPFILAFVLLPLRVCCQTVQDDWTAPAAPDGSTSLQSGSKFTLLWKSSLQNDFKTYCPSCDTKKLDLWITNFNGTTYTSKIGRGIDLTATSSYEWNVNIASNTFSEVNFWVFRFIPFDAAVQNAEQVSSPGFRISGLAKASSTTTVLSSSATNTPQPTEKPFTQSSSSKSKTWIAGVVVGPLTGIALGAVLMWFCLRKRKNQKTQQNQREVRLDYGNGIQQYPPDQHPKEGHSQTARSDTQPWQIQTGNQSQYIVEAPGSLSPAEPAELWHGNYRS